MKKAKDPQPAAAAVQGDDVRDETKHHDRIGILEQRLDGLSESVNALIAADGAHTAGAKAHNGTLKGRVDDLERAHKDLETKMTDIINGLTARVEKHESSDVADLPQKAGPHFVP
jgi:hypothetical protein